MKTMGIVRKIDDLVRVIITIYNVVNGQRNGEVNSPCRWSLCDVIFVDDTL